MKDILELFNAPFLILFIFIWIIAWERNIVARKHDTPLLGRIFGFLLTMCALSMIGFVLIALLSGICTPPPTQNYPSPYR